MKMDMDYQDYLLSLLWEEIPGFSNTSAMPDILEYSEPIAAYYCMPLDFIRLFCQMTIGFDTLCACQKVAL